MALKFEELRVLQAAEAVADGIWRYVIDPQLSLFSKEDLGALATIRNT